MVKTPSVAYLTILASNYLPKALALADSLREHEGAELHVLLIDVPTPDQAPALPGVTMTYDAGSTLYRSTAPATLLYGQANIEVRQIQCTGQREPGMQAGSIQYAFFNVRATATGTLGGSATVNQGVRTVVPSGAC